MGEGAIAQQTFLAGAQIAEAEERAAAAARGPSPAMIKRIVQLVDDRKSALRDHMSLGRVAYASGRYPELLTVLPQPTEDKQRATLRIVEDSDATIVNIQEDDVEVDGEALPRTLLGAEHQMAAYRRTSHKPGRRSCPPIQLTPPPR